MNARSRSLDWRGVARARALTLPGQDLRRSSVRFPTSEGALPRRLLARPSSPHDRRRSLEGSPLDAVQGPLLVRRGRPPLFLRWYPRRNGSEAKATRCYNLAGESWLKAAQYLEAGRAFEKAKNFELSATSYRRAGEFEVAVKVVLEHRDSLKESTAVGIIDVAKVQFARLVLSLSPVLRRLSF